MCVLMACAKYHLTSQRILAQAYLLLLSNYSNALVRIFIMSNTHDTHIRGYQQCARVRIFIMSNTHDTHTRAHRYQRCARVRIFMISNTHDTHTHAQVSAMCACAIPAAARCVSSSRSSPGKPVCACMFE